jgi:hypothetical protein
MEAGPRREYEIRSYENSGSALRSIRGIDTADTIRLL